ncbi:metallophosphoesterase family protein [Candidatus Poriferisodalis sp.]|uniref:metallophosphoesterase family protein n=1 Tax=Candidatus Poriferisodalis sp. TaxID=3101277 RepID=UPI003C70288F
MKFIHTADWQLGMTRHFLSGEAQPRFTESRVDAIRRIGQLATDEGCEFVVVCGDVFESNQIDRKVLARALDAMATTPSVTFYLLPGNHDPLDAASIFSSNTFRERPLPNVIVLEDSAPIRVAEGVELVAAPWTSKRPLRDLVDQACAVAEPSAALRIITGHGALDSRSPDAANPALISLERLEERVEAGQINYVALGDRHSTTDEGTSGRIWYSGAPEPTDYDETDPGNVLVVELRPERVEVTPRKIGTWSFQQHESHLTSDADIDSLEQWLNALEDKQRTVVKLSLVGQVSLAQKGRLDRLLDHFADLFAALETWERRSDLVVVPDEIEVADLGLSGFANDALGDLQELALASDAFDDESRAVAAQDAMALLYRLVGSAQ